MDSGARLPGLGCILSSPLTSCDLGQVTCPLYSMVSSSFKTEVKMVFASQDYKD